MVPTVLSEFLSVGESSAEEFFRNGLRRVVRIPVREDEITYVASVLEYYSMVSCSVEDNVLPCPRNLTDVFESFFLDTLPDSVQEPQEVAGGQIMFMLGFFGTQMSQKHNVPWYLWAGAGALADASMALRKEDPTRAMVLYRVARNFPFWTGQIRLFQQGLANYPEQFWAPQDTRVQ